MKKHKGRHDLVGEHQLGDLGQILLFILFLIVWIMDSFYLHYSDFISGYIPWAAKIPVSLILLTFSGYYAKSGLNIVFGEVRLEPVVFKEGVFGKSRHPVYLGAIGFYLGLLILFPSISAIFIWLVIIGFYQYIAKYEEKLLLDKLGSAYEQYMQQVPRWIPRIRGKHF